MSTTHELKTWPDEFDAVCRRLKTFDIRKADRPFAVGDTLLLREWDPVAEQYGTESAEARVIYLVPPGHWGLPKDLCVMGIMVTHQTRAR